MSDSSDTNIKKVHFMGIGGSGMSAVALIAKSQGYNVTGCDLEESTPYLDEVKSSGINVFVGHDKLHLKDADALCVTPAAYYQNKDHPEIELGKKKMIMQWQEFMGKYLHEGKKVICIAGTHGKSTTTTMAGLLYDYAKKDPTVEVGAKVLKWKSNYKIGKSKIFISEADEFYGNFLNYHPDIIILNNIEFDHPDFFEDEDQVYETFRKFISNLKGLATLIINQDDSGNKKLLESLDKDILERINIIGYTLGSEKFTVENSFKGQISNRDKNGTSFRVENRQYSLNNEFSIKVPGDYNVYNALGVIVLSLIEGISVGVTQKFLSSFSGSGRRMELIGEKKGIKVFDDYAHHPTAIKVTLSGLRQLYPKNRLVCVVEPHMFSRTKALLSLYKGVFSDADVVFIAPIFKSRDLHNHGVSSQSIVSVSEHHEIEAIALEEEVSDKVVDRSKKGDVIIVMGAGKSYLFAREILKKL